MSDHLFTYVIVLAVYLLGLVLIGLLTGRRTRNVEDFYLGGRKIGPWVTAFSFVAAYFSSVVIIGGGGFGYMFGLATLWIGAINVVLGTLAVWIILGPRIREFTQRLNTMTIPGFLGKRYQSNFALVFCAVIIVLFMIIYNVSILKGMGHIFQVLINIPYIYGVVLSGIIILFYVSVGGYLAVVWTGFTQAVVMGVSLLVLTIAALVSAGGLTAVNKSLEVINPGLIRTPGVWGWPGLLSFALIVSFGVWGMPQLLVRFYSIKNIKVIRAGTVMATIGTCMALLPYLNGAIARVLFPNLVNPDLAIPTLAKNILSSFGAAIVLAGVVAAGMSTFASVLIILSGSIVEDVIRLGFKFNISKEKALALGKLSSALIGLISIFIAFRPPALVLTLTAFSWAVIASTTLWPILFGLYWKGTTKKGCVYSMVGGSVTALVWMLAGKPWGVHGFIPGIVVGLILIVVVSLCTEKLPSELLNTIYRQRETGN